MGEHRVGAEPKRPGQARRRAIVVSSDEGLVRTSLLRPGQPLPLVVEPVVKGVSLLDWIGGAVELVERQLHEHGALLFRNFGVRAVEDFERVVETVSGGALEYRERSSPRTSVGGRIYTSTDYPAEHSIFLHNENSYQQTWPMKIFFYCAQAAARGGETPIADCRRVLARLDPQVRERFAERGWMYVRNFGDGFGLPWQTVFQTTERAEVESHCRAVGVGVEWKPGDRLRTRAVRPAVARHPRTGEQVWFNHATFFHVTMLEEGVREALLGEFAEEDLPTNTYYGDGSPIEPETLEGLREAYRRESVAFAWQEGDVLLLDNMLTAHGRAPYEGARKILVGMGQPMSWNDIERQRSGEER